LDIFPTYRVTWPDTGRVRIDLAVASIGWQA
jgi:hypothetical protein